MPDSNFSNLPALRWKTGENNMTLTTVKDCYISPLTPALHYGLGVFGGMRAYWNAEHVGWYIFRLKEHLERLEKSWKALYMDIPFSQNDLVEPIRELVDAVGLQSNLYIRSIAFVAGEGIGVRLHDWPFALMVFAIPLERYLSKDIGLSVMVSPWPRIPAKSAPVFAKATGLYVSTALSVTLAKKVGFDDAIVLTSEGGHVAEASAANIFVIDSRGKVVTPPASDDILLGITRRSVIRILEDDMGVSVLEHSLGLGDLYGARGIFCTGTAWQIASIGLVNQVDVGDPKHPIIMELRERYDKIVYGNDVRSKEWCTFVPCRSRE